MWVSEGVEAFLGKYQSFVEENSLPELIERKSAWNEVQLANFTLLRQLINDSDEVSNAFINRTTAMDSEWKDGTFLHDLPPLPHLM
jgi:hypothetical protein